MPLDLVDEDGAERAASYGYGYRGDARFKFKGIARELEKGRLVREVDLERGL